MIITLYVVLIFFIGTLYVAPGLLPVLIIVKICGRAVCGRTKPLEESAYRAQNITEQGDFHESISYFGLFRR